MPWLQFVGTRNANGFWRGPQSSAGDVCRRATGRPRGPGRTSLRGAGGMVAGQSAGGGWHRARGSLRDQRGEAFQLGTARQAAHSQKTQPAADYGLPSVAGSGAGGGETGGVGLPGRYGGAGVAGQGFSRQPATGADGVFASGAIRDGDRASIFDSARTR